MIVGGGFGGLLLARGLRGADLDVTVVDRQNFFLFQPLVYQVATGSLSSVEVAVPLRQALRRRHNVHVVLGEVTGFDLALDLRVAAFHADVLRELAAVPYGLTTTYGALARQVGRPSAARAVGTVMNRNPIPIVLPCHRVVGANGALTGYAGGLDIKRHLLRLEGAALV